MKIDSLLIANRGEIACRIMATAKAMGLHSVAVYSAIDAQARHVREADSTVCLGGVKPADSYLRIDSIIAAAKASGVQAVHPGYGFLSENAEFARALQEAGLIFIGPPAAAIEAMGSKSAAKALMEQAGVPLVPGYHGAAQDLATFAEAAKGIGYPVLLKAAAGGGGKGMKLVQSEDELADALASAQREAQSAFGDCHMLLEKYLLQPRHVEIQVFADQHGNCLYLNERDCSIQRRHQKVVEEAPAPGLSAALRRAMGETAVKAAQAIGYVGAGTVEFLLDAQGRFYFMEMNTRLQVEHPVTEAITGLDLVAWQIRVACGEVLPIAQQQVPLLGHAIEIRLYAEDADKDFLPSSGALKLYREPASGPGRRVDSGVAEGDSISPFYDPMLAKLIAWGENREQARLRLLAMLEETLVAGVVSNLGFVRRILTHPAFIAAELNTGFIERHLDDLLSDQRELPQAFWQLAAEAFLFSEPFRQRQDDTQSPWAQRQGWRMGLAAETDLLLSCAGQQRLVQLRGDSKSFFDGTLFWSEQQGVRRSYRLIRQQASLYLDWQGQMLEVKQHDPIAASSGVIAESGGLNAPMNGSVVQVLVEPGQVVEAGALLVVLEAMKMEHSIRAPHGGIVEELYCQVGELISEGSVLIGLRQI